MKNACANNTKTKINILNKTTFSFGGFKVTIKINPKDLKPKVTISTSTNLNKLLKNKENNDE